MNYGVNMLDNLNTYWVIFLIPVVWFFTNLSYEIVKLFRLWLKLKLQNIKEYSLWD